MSKFNLLECTLRDGGYITDWVFPSETIRDIIKTLSNANLDFVEVGYLNHRPYVANTTQFQTIEQISEFLPEHRENSQYLAMADVQQFLPQDLTAYTGKSIDGIRVVFYKHQIEEAMEMSRAVKAMGYKLFVQPMVTIDYSISEYTTLTSRVAQLAPFGVSIVDSFGYMVKSDFRNYFKILDDNLPSETVIGFHSHNNMNYAFITAQDVLEYSTERELIVDASLYGMGRGAGNLQTELIANYYNQVFGSRYAITKILELISTYIMPIRAKHEWGYSPYLFLTALYHCHPNFACYLRENHKVSVADFEQFICSVPEEMKTKCKRPYVEQLWRDFQHEQCGA